MAMKNNFSKIMAESLERNVLNENFEAPDILFLL